MTRRHRTALRYAAAAIVGMAGLMMSERSVLLQDGPAITGAEGRIGRPLTPMSYAGVARRTTRRAVYGAAVVAPVAGAVAVSRRCVQQVDAYGRIVRRCY